MFVINHLRRHTVGYLALFVALSGGAYAATALPANSVGTAQVKNHSLLKADFKNGQIPAGKRGPAGERGPAGTFDASNVARVVAPMTALCAYNGGDCAIGSSVATCAGGSAPIGGGWLPDPSHPALGIVLYNGPSGADGWGVILRSVSDGMDGGFQAVAVCGSGGVAALARQGPSNLDALRRTLAAKYRAGGLSIR